MISKRVQTTIGNYPVAFAAAFLFLFSIAIYAGTLRHGFVWDDEGVFTNAPEIREFSNIPTFFTKPLILGESDQPGTEADIRIRYYRPLLSSLHVVEYHFFGANPVGYKVVNLLLNGVVVVCAFLLVRALTGATPLAFLATLLYAANPARSEVVYWAYSDSHIFAALFALLTLLAYHRGRTSLALGLMAVGLLFQESVILVAGALLVYQLTIPAEHGRRWRRIIPFVALATAYLVVRRLVAGALPLADLDLLYRLRAAAYLLVKHLQITFVTDAPVTMYPYVPGMFEAGGATTPAIALGAVLFLLAGVWLWWRFRRWFFWYAWFVVWIAIAFNIGGYAGYLMAEKSLYLAALGPCVLLSAIVVQSGHYRSVGIALLLALATYQAWTTIDRGQYWTDTVTYIEKLLEFEPRFNVAIYQLGVEYMRAGRYEEAVQQFDRLVQLHPAAHRRIRELQAESFDLHGRKLAEQGDLTGALASLEKARALAPGVSRIYNGLGVVHFLRGDRAQAITNWQTALKLDPKNIEARTNLESFRAKEEAP